MEKDQDLDLVLKCKAGQKECFAELYDKYSKKIYCFIYYRVHHKETAEDLTSQTFFKAFEKIELVDPGKGKFSSWLFQIAKNCVRDHFRVTFSEEDLDSAFDLHSSSNLQRDADIALGMDKISKQLQSLSKEQREILLMRLWDGFTYKEISEILGLGESKCKMTLSRTLVKLQKEMTLLAFFILVIRMVK